MDVEVYSGNAGNPLRPRYTVTFVPTGQAWVVYGDGASKITDDDKTTWTLELVEPE